MAAFEEIEKKKPTIKVGWRSESNNN